MLTNYVSCEECIYKDVCHQFDAFFGCDNGKKEEEDDYQPIITSKKKEVEITII